MSNPSTAKNHPRKLPPLKGFDYGLVGERLTGLLVNVDRDLERRGNEAINKFDAEADRQLSLLHLMIRFASNSYKAAFYLCADTPTDHNRQTKFVLVVPTINRQLLDLLFSLVFMLDDFPSRSLGYQRAAYRELCEENHQFKSHFGSDPDWKHHFENTKAVIARTAERHSITEEEKRNPSLIPYWKHPFELKDEPTKSRGFLRYLNKWLYSDTSAQAHLSFAGLLRVAPFLIADLVGEEAQKLVEERAIKQYRFVHITRLAFTVLAIATEIDMFCRLGNRDSTAYLWVMFSEHVPEAKELWEQRYQSLYQTES
jgi:hypothetical protein